MAAAQDNFVEAARNGMNARLYWPGLGEVTPDELVLRHLLPMADEGLRRWRVAAEVRDRYLGVIEGRAKISRNRSSWQVETVNRWSGMEWTGRKRWPRCCTATATSCNSNAPVHTWP